MRRTAVLTQYGRGPRSAIGRSIHSKPESGGQHVPQSDRARRIGDPGYRVRRLAGALAESGIGKGDVVAVITGTQTYDFYDNADVCSTGGTATTCRHNDGVIGCFNSQTCAGVNIFNNTFSEPSNCGWNVTGGAATMTVKNNLFFNCGSVGMSGGTNTIDYNSYLNSSRSAVGTHDVSVSSGAANPFMAVGIGNVRLAVESSNYNNRTSLGSPYDTLDLYGNAFTTDRGAAQYTSVTPMGAYISAGILLTGAAVQ